MQNFLKAKVRCDILVLTISRTSLEGREEAARHMSPQGLCLRTYQLATNVNLSSMHLSKALLVASCYY